MEKITCVFGNMIGGRRLRFSLSPLQSRGRSFSITGVRIRLLKYSAFVLALCDPTWALVSLLQLIPITTVIQHGQEFHGFCFLFSIPRHRYKNHYPPLCILDWYRSGQKPTNNAIHVESGGPEIVLLSQIFAWLVSRRRCGSVCSSLSRDLARA